MKKVITIVMLSASMHAVAWFDEGFGGSDFSRLNHYLNQKFYDIYQEIHKLQQTSFDDTSSIQYFDEKTQQYIIKLNTTIAKENITINTTDEYIAIKGLEENTQGKQQQVNSFAQTISLPNDADVSKISAKKEGQLLTISIAKLSQPKPQFKTINIE
jgi:HSP20 family molecular chaperone IbpA